MMKSFMILVALLCFVFLPNQTLGSQKKPWPLPSDLANHHGNMGGSKVSNVNWACSWVSDPRDPPLPPGTLPPLPNLPGVPKIPTLPNIPIPNIPGLPNIPFPTIPGLPNIPGIPIPPFQSLLVSQSSELEKCLSGKEGSKLTEKCFSQVFSSWAENDFSLDKECCDIVLNMDKKCNEHFHMMFKSHFFAPLLQYSCHIKHSEKKN